MKACDRCGQPAIGTVTCPVCSTKKEVVTHTLCAACMEAFQRYYFNEGPTCILRDPILKKR